jgi:hypothetical protein
MVPSPLLYASAGSARPPPVKSPTTRRPPTLLSRNVPLVYQAPDQLRYRIGSLPPGQ